MLYVIIMYCTGFCPSEAMAPPSDALFYSSYADCQAHLKEFPDFKPQRLAGSPIDTAEKQTCARVLAEPKQLDRILIPEQLEKLLKEYKAHGDGYKPWIGPGCEDSKSVCTINDVVGPCGKGKGFGCLFKAPASTRLACTLDAPTLNCVEVSHLVLKPSELPSCNPDLLHLVACVEKPVTPNKVTVP
jgi:hypothetical protein